MQFYASVRHGKNQGVKETGRCPLFPKIVARQNELRTAIDEIVADIEGK
jgi:hypothetical protein